MRKYILLTLMVCVLCSCGIFKKVTKSRSRESLDSTESVKVRSSKVDKSTITITEKVDTVVRIPAQQATAELPVKQATDGTVTIGSDTVTVDSSLFTLKLYFDSLSKSIKVIANLKEQLIPVLVNKVTNIHKNVTEQNSEDKKTQVSKEKIVMNKQSDPDYMWVLYLIGAISLVGLVAYLIHKYKIV